MAGWVLVDYPVLRKSATAPAGSGQELLPIVFDEVPVDYVWRVDAITGWVPVGGAENMLVYDQPQGPNVIPIDYGNLTPIGNILNVALEGPPIGGFVAVCDRSAPLTIRGGDQLSVLFTGVNTGATCWVRVQYQLFQGTAAVPRPILGKGAPAIPAGI